MTWIGDNVFIGMNATILMGAHIGDNSIVGAGAVVGGKYPDNSVIAGNPASVICTIEEFSAKRKSKELDKAALYANIWKMKYGEYPSISQMGNAFSWLYLPHTQETIEQYPNFFKLSGVDNQQLKKDFLATKPEFENFESFLEYCENSG
ncbi:acyltransferase [Phascolarctobacterium sp.]|uniref:acyltransferase n=1 Tax=Phascolarctobacterium sp. TaxID=2049039 RepID=UPI003F7D82AA